MQQQQIQQSNQLNQLSPANMTTQLNQPNLQNQPHQQSDYQTINQKTDQPPLNNEPQKGQNGCLEGIKLLHTFSELLKNENQDQHKQILIQEQLIYTGIYILEQSPLARLPFDLKLEIQDFVRRVNELSIKGQDSGGGGGVAKNWQNKIILKAIDLLNLKNISVFIDNPNALAKLRVTTFSNLSFIYRDLCKFQEALKAVNYGIQILIDRIKENQMLSFKDIITSLLNRSAILSELDQHDQSIASIQQALEFIQKEISNNKNQADFDSLQCDYLSMVANFNMANEFETLGQIQKAITFYQESSSLAQKVKNLEMVEKIDSILTILTANLTAKK